MECHLKLEEKQVVRKRVHHFVTLPTRKPCSSRLVEIRGGPHFATQTTRERHNLPYRAGRTSDMRKSHLRVEIQWQQNICETFRCHYWTMSFDEEHVWVKKTY